MSERRSLGVTDKGPDEAHVEQAVDALRQALRGLRYGSLSITIHEGRVVQLDVTEKRRF